MKIPVKAKIAYNIIQCNNCAKNIVSQRHRNRQCCWNYNPPDPYFLKNEDGWCDAFVMRGQ